MPPLNLQVSADNDECRLAAGIFQLAPPLLEVGRWNAPAEMVGSGIRFQNVTIPQGAPIDSAVLILTAWQTRVPAVRSRISAEQVDNGGDFSGDNWLSAWIRLNNHGIQVDWDALSWTLDVEYTSPDISAVIQEIINRAGWVPGQAIVLSWDDFDHRTPWVGIRTQRGYSHVVDNTKAAKLNIIYTGAGVPTVTTDPATSIISNSASLNGTLDTGGLPCECHFEWGETPAYGKTTPLQNIAVDGPFAQTLYPLKPYTTYYFRAFASNALGTDYGAQRSFTTSQVPYYASLISPQVQTNPATLITEHTARLNGIVVEDGGIMGAVRFQWGLTTEYGMNTPWQQGYGKGDEFLIDLNNLAEGQGFHFRAQFRVGGKLVSGSDMVFNTLFPLGPVTLVTDEIMQLLEAV